MVGSALIIVCGPLVCIKTWLMKAIAVCFVTLQALGGVGLGELGRCGCANAGAHCMLWIDSF